MLCSPLFVTAFPLAFFFVVVGLSLKSFGCPKNILNKLMFNSLVCYCKERFSEKTRHDVLHR